MFCRIYGIGPKVPFIRYFTSLGNSRESPELEVSEGGGWGGFFTTQETKWPRLNFIF